MSTATAPTAPKARKPASVLVPKTASKGKDGKVVSKIVDKKNGSLKGSSGTHGVKRTAAAAAAAEGEEEEEEPAAAAAKGEDEEPASEPSSPKAGASEPKKKKAKPSKQPQPTSDEAANPEESSEMADSAAPEPETEAETEAPEPSSSKKKEKKSKIKESKSKESKSNGDVEPEVESAEHEAKEPASAEETSGDSAPPSKTASPKRKKGSKGDRGQLLAIVGKEKREGDSDWSWKTEWENAKESLWMRIGEFDMQDQAVLQLMCAFEAKWETAEKGEADAEDAEIVPDLTQLTEDTYFPQRIIDDRWNGTKHRKEYRVQWWQSDAMKAVCKPDFSWEPEENLEGSKDMLDSWKESRKEKAAAASSDESAKEGGKSNKKKKPHSGRIGK